MIREYNKDDLLFINSIGLQIKNDFVNKFNINNLNNVEKVYVYEQENKVIGFIHISSLYETIDILNIAVDINYQHLGIGCKLINYIKDNFDWSHIMLEVRESNMKAIKLYEKCGFQVINIRKNYYGNESALVMEVNKS